jgi:hypothetical protein
MKVNGFDIDGVIHLGNGVCGIRPGPQDVIITGRSQQEEAETLAFLRRNGINNTVFFNQVPYERKTRVSSGQHKAKTILDLSKLGIQVDYFYEDDEVQAQEIRKAIDANYLDTKVIFVNNPFVDKENRRHLEDL